MPRYYTNAQAKSHKKKTAAVKKNRGRYYQMGPSTTQEVAAGVVAPGYESLRTGKGALRKELRSDPRQSKAFKVLQKQALSAPGSSPWAKMQMQKQALAEQDLMDQTAQAQATGLAQAQSNLMRQGGLSSGARERMAAQGAKDLMLAQQQARRAGISDRLGIGESDINRQQQLLGQVGQTELAAQEANIGRQLQDIQNKGQFDMNRYQTQMGAYGAEQTAAGQVDAAKKAKKK